MHRLLAAVLLLLGSPAFPQHPDKWCGTSRENDAHLEALHAIVAAQSTRARSASSLIRYENGIFVMPADSSTTLEFRPLDLVGSSIRLTPTDGAYRIERLPLQYDETVGPVVLRRSSTVPEHYEYSATRGGVRFGNREVNRFYISELIGIFLSPPAASSTPSDATPEVSTLEAATLRVPLIAPLLQRRLSPTLGSTMRELFVVENERAITVTWRAGANDILQYDVQAKLFRDGVILFSYKSPMEMSWGSLLVTTGDEPWRAAKTSLGNATDPLGDAIGSMEWRRILDIQNVEVSRISGSDLIEVRIKLGADASHGALPANGTGRVYVTFSQPNAFDSVWLELGRSGSSYCIAARCSIGSNAATSEGDTVTLRVLDRQLASTLTAPVRIGVTTNDPSGLIADSLGNGLMVSGRANGTVDLDLSTLTSRVDVSGPVLESFTVPKLLPDGVWLRLKQQFTLEDGEVDAVAVFQTFDTDLTTFSPEVLAYAMPGNPQADGVRFDYGGLRDPKYPTLIHMNQLRRNSSVSNLHAQRVLGHEFGHRWLTRTAIREGSSNSRVLNPVSPHPAQYVHLPAAVPIRFTHDCSVMGGAAFTDNGNGTFTTPGGGWYSYSWLDLYLMGLAAPAEVQPFFYIRGSSLGGEYAAPAGTFSGTRVDVTIDQVVAAMGTRAPTPAKSQRLFRILFVLLESPDAPASHEDVAKVSTAMTAFEDWFTRATLQRGRLIFSVPVQPTASFRVSPAAAVEMSVDFLDTSTNYPSSWLWSFGDGTTSAEQHPSKAFRTPGTYHITLKVRNSRGESSAQQEIVIGATPGRRRAIGR